MSVLQPLAKAHNNSYLIESSQSAYKATISGLVWMVLGSVTVFGLIFVMNNSSVPEPKKKEASSISFEVQKLEKPKPKQQIKPKPKPRPQKAQPRLAPMQGLSSSIGGISFGMPEFDMGAMDAANDSILGDMSNVVMTDETVDVPPKPAKRTAMAYPSQARKKGITGYVILNLLIDQTGAVKTIRLLESSPAGVFDQAAIDGVKNWKFEPAVYQGQKVQVWAQQKVRFDLG